MDQMVLKVQQWLNSTYGTNSKYTNLFPNQIAENGVTGTQVEQALIAALQIELGISSPTGTFGPATTSAFTSMQARSSSGDLTTPTNKEYILQGGLWCKGYNPGGWSGIFYTGTQSAVKQFQADAGLTNLNGIVTAMIMKALLNTDPFVLASDGDSKIRQLQMDINNRYNAYTGLLPTNGIYVAATNKALIYALQAEEGLSTSAANGSFGPTTTADCPTLSEGDTRTGFVIILKYALYCNGFYPGDFNGTYDSQVASAVEGFQSFMALPVTGVANMSTIKATLASCGDTSRVASACDCATILTASKAATLVSNGYKVVGRYLSGTAGGVSKALTLAEIDIIDGAGLRYFPIFEENGTSVSYFTSSQGTTDAQKAVTAALNLRFPNNVTIYFAVDVDAMDSQVTSNIIPYFTAISTYFKNSVGGRYKIGVYGARNICTRVCNETSTVNSFVADMSTGYSGNLGYRMTSNWSFDQFTSVTLGSGSSQIAIDKNGYSGVDSGANYRNWANPTDGVGNGILYVNRAGSPVKVFAEKVVDDITGLTQPANQIDSIPPNAFYCFMPNYASGNDGNDHVNRIIYARSGGGQSEGYIYTGGDGYEGDEEYENIWNNQEYFYNFRCNPDTSAADPLTASQPFTYNRNTYYSYTLSNDTDYYNKNGLYQGTIQQGTQVGLPSGNTGATYPWLVNVSLKYVNGSWAELIAGELAYMNVRFDLGAMPNNRLLK